MKNLSLKLLAVLCIISVNINAQWQNEWTSTSINSEAVSGWIDFVKNGDSWETRFYSFTATSFLIMSSPYSSTVEYSYTFTQEEIDAGYLIYSLEQDLTGDGIVEFYVLSQYGSAEPYRQSFKIIDIANGTTVFEKNSSNYYYSYPTIWDVDNDGTLECSFTQYDYPNFTSYQYYVYDTGITTSTTFNGQVKPLFKLNQNYPNPFNPSTRISFSLDEPGSVRLSVYSITGEKIADLLDEFKQPGIYNVDWNGKNNFGNNVSAGQYIYTLRNNGKVISKKMILLK